MRRVTIEVHGADDAEMDRILNYWLPGMGFPDDVSADAATYLISHEDGLSCQNEWCEHCTVQAQVEARPEALRIAQHAAGFLDGSDTESVEGEYLRALAELVCDLAGLPVERKGEVGTYLWEMSGAIGPVPHYVTSW